MSLPITYLIINGEKIFNQTYQSLIKKIPWYCIGKKRKYLLKRCNMIASRKAAHAMTMENLPFRRLEIVLIEIKGLIK